MKSNTASFLGTPGICDGVESMAEQKGEQKCLKNFPTSGNVPICQPRTQALWSIKLIHAAHAKRLGTRLPICIEQCDQIW
jgi:hypothetical protein